MAIEEYRIINPHIYINYSFR